MLIEIILMGVMSTNTESSLAKDAADFSAICLWENRGKIRNDAHNRKENARGPAQIRPGYLKDANEWRVKMGLKPYTHLEMHDHKKAFNTFRAYMARYRMKTTEQRARSHNGGPAGPKRKSTLGYWKGVQTYLEK